jgi:hypothetical protein
MYLPAGHSTQSVLGRNVSIKTGESRAPTGVILTGINALPHDWRQPIGQALRMCIWEGSAVQPENTGPLLHVKGENSFSKIKEI